MTEQITELKERLVVGSKRDGRNCYDPQAKRELIEASLQPGVSVAKLALTHGINANLLRKWIGKHQCQSMASGLPAIRRNAGAVYPGGAGQHSTYADHATGTGGPAAEWRSTGMVVIVA